MADVEKINVGGTNYNICDATARANIPTKTSNLINDSNFPSIYVPESSPWARFQINQFSSLNATLSNITLNFNTPYGGEYWCDYTINIPASVRLTIPLSCNVQVFGSMGIIHCQFLSYNNSQIVIRLGNGMSGTFTVGLSVNMNGYT